MRKVIVSLLTLISFIFLFEENALSSHPDNVNWRNFIFDKEEWPFGMVYKINYCGDNIYLSGYWEEYLGDTNSYFNLALLKDSTWHPMGNGYLTGVRGIYPSVNFIYSQDSLVYIGGNFDSAGSIKAQNIAIWNNNSNQWSSLGKGINGRLNKVDYLNNNLVIAGDFDKAFLDNDTIFCKNLIKWTDTNWVNFPCVPNGSITDLLVYDNNKLIVVGEFDSVNNIRANRIAIWDDSSEIWTSFNSYGPLGNILNVAKIGNTIFVSGRFDSTLTENGKIYTKNIAKWNGYSWQAIQGGINGVIRDMKVKNNDLIIAGKFKKIINDSINANNIVKWDGNNWKEFGDGADDVINVICFKNDSLLIGGNFFMTSDSIANRIGLWYDEPSQGLIYNGKISNLNGLKIKMQPSPIKRLSTAEIILEILESNVYEIRIYDLNGKFVNCLTKEEFTTGKHIIKWDRVDLIPGIYFIRLLGNNQEINQKIIVEN